MYRRLSASRELARLVLLDAAHLLEEDVRHSAGRVGHDGTTHDTKVPLYSTLDALNCLDYFGRTAVYSQVLEVAAGVHATFIDAGYPGLGKHFPGARGTGPSNQRAFLGGPGQHRSPAAAQPCDATAR
jgi:hypothetical protein